MNNISGEQKLLGIIAHLSYLLGGVGFIIAPLVILLLKKNDFFVAHHARQALVAHLVVIGISLVVSLLCTVIVGFLLIPALIIVWLALIIASIMAGIKTFNGELYYYPLIQELVAKLENR